MATRAWQRALLPSALLGSVVGAHLARAQFGPLDALAVGALPVLCPLRLLSGVACPTCGLGRSLLATWSGDLARGLGHHPAGPVLLFGATALMLAYAARPQVAVGAVRSAAAALRSHRALAPGLVFLYALWGFLRQTIL